MSEVTDTLAIDPAGTTPSARVAVLPVVEHFHSIQGEGTRVGEVSTFIRFAGCNLRCSWCDTPYSWTPDGVKAAARLPLEEVAALARERAVVLTGGEPMLHARHLPLLVAAMRRDHGVAHVTVETNATIVPGHDLLGAIDLWSLSPKLAGSGEPFPTGPLARLLAAAHALDGDLARCQLKLVCADLPGDWHAIWPALDGVRAHPDAASIPAAAWQALPLLVQPDGLREDYADAIRELAELVIADDVDGANGRPRRDGVRVVPQVHRIAWGVRARGV